MSAVWPPGLPQSPQIGGYSAPFPNRLLTYSMDSGDDKTRRRGPKPVEITVRYLMTDAQVSVLETFCAQTIGSGAIWFDWPHPKLGRAVRAKIVPTQSALYTSVPQGSGMYWLIGMTIKYWPDAPLT